MVSQKVLIRKKWRRAKKLAGVSVVVLLVILILGGMFIFGFFTKKGGSKIILENPLKDIVFANTNAEGLVDKQAVIEQGVLEFNADYINYILVALGVGNLHSFIGFGNPVIEMVVDDEIWNSEIDEGIRTQRGAIDNEDLRIVISRKEAVEALLSSDITEFMKGSVREGRTGIEMVAGKPELLSKGYLSMYKEITGEELDVE